MTVDRRTFLKTAAGASLTFGVSAGADQELHAAKPVSPLRKSFDAYRPDVAVVGAGAFGIWTALYLNRLGAKCHRHRPVRAG